MRARFAYIVHQLRESFWLLPAILALGAVGLSMVTATLDRQTQTVLTGVMPWTEGLGLENARLIMSTVAGAMITVTSLVFSLTLVSLTLASGQLGPRLLSLFMRDRMTQAVLGVFIATFVFALLVLATLSERASVVPNLSVAVALLLTLLSVGFLISFIHHLATSLHADLVVARVAEEVNQQLSRLLAPRDPDREATGGADDSGADWTGDTSILSPAGGYIQAIDCRALVGLARAHDTVIRMRVRAGHFVCIGEPVAWVRDPVDPVDDFARELSASIVFGPRRTQAEDPEFGLQAIVEIALRALSPGINDPHTALTCIDRLGETLVGVLRGQMPSPVYRDSNGAIRVQAMPLTVQGLVDTAFNEIRQAAGSNVAVLIRLGETLQRLAQVADTTKKRQIIAGHAEMLARAGDATVSEEGDRRDIHECLGELQAALGSEAGGRSS